MYEFGRIRFKDEKIRNEFENEFNKYLAQTPWKIITKLTEYLVKNKIQILLILDQFSSKTVEPIFYDKVEKQLNNFLKILISFSISDNNDFNNIAKSLEKNKGNPSSLTKENQEYFFYYCNLLDRQKIRPLNVSSEKNKMYNLFDFNPKYIYLLDDSGIKFIKNKIIKYFEFHCKIVGINDVNPYLFNFSKSINKKFSFSELYNITTNIPMKYCYLIFENNTFEIRYQFNYIETLIKETLQLERVKDYFLESRDKEEYFEKKLKGDYFECLANDVIKRNQNVYFGKKIKHFLTVKDIISMGKYEDNKNDDMIIENFENLIQSKTIKRKAYYDNKIKLLDTELKNLRSPIPELNTDHKDINYFKYETFSNVIKLLQKKRNPDSHNDNENKEEIFSKKDKNKKINPKGETGKKLKTKQGNDSILDDPNEINNNNKETNSKYLEDDISIIDYKDELINNGIIISQKNVCGKTLDLAVLLGESSHKKFIGFQMKYYEQGTHLKNPQNLAKITLKENMKPILINCLKEFNIKIVEWHYIFCIYYNPNEKNSYNKTLVTNCNQYDIEYIFFDPINETFYYRDFSPIDGEFKLTFRSNLDCYSSTNPYIIFQNNQNILEKYAIQRAFESNVEQKYEKIFDVDIKDIINKLKNIFGSNFEIICEFKCNRKYPFPILEKDYLLLFKSKQKNSFIYYYNKDDNNFICGETNNDSKYDALSIFSYIKYEQKENVQFYVFKKE